MIEYKGFQIPELEDLDDPTWFTTGRHIGFKKPNGSLVSSSIKREDINNIHYPDKGITALYFNDAMFNEARIFIEAYRNGF